MNRILVPPIKCQGIKTKLVPLILANAPLLQNKGMWVEPFMGSGVVGLNARPARALFTDLNPHIIAFYNALNSPPVTPGKARAFLEYEGNILREKGEAHYYFVRERFNRDHDPLDFLFLSRACFNGMIRFNSKGGFNVPFCRKPDRFSQPYITKIVNQLAQFSDLINYYDWSFRHQDFEQTIHSATERDFIYCDPPYLGRHVDYYDSWSFEDEQRLFNALSVTKAKFILSTWHSNQYRTNSAFESLWSKFHYVTQEHFYHVGASENNRNPMVEALIMNFPPTCERIAKSKRTQEAMFADLSQPIR